MKNASSNDSSKKNAGYKAAEYVEDGMVLGLGTGSTTHYFIEKVGIYLELICGFCERGFGGSVIVQEIAD